MEEIDERAEQLLSNIELRSEILESDSELEITEEMEELMDEIEKKDGRYSLTLDDPDIYLKLSILCYSNDRLDEAEEWVDKALRLKNGYLGFLLRGKVLQMKKDPKGALGEYDEALRYDEEWMVHKYRYEVLKERDKLERASNALDKAIELKESGELLAKKADLLMDMDEVDRAKDLYNRAEELDPELQNKKKKIRELLDEAEKKIVPDIYDNILRLDDTVVEAWLGKAECYHDLNKGEKAIEILEKAQECTDTDKIAERLEKYKEEESSSIECKNCGGTGTCPECEGSGDCIRCAGSGNCKECKGTTNCNNSMRTGECNNCNCKEKT
ncbi:MAG: hypothetical protein V5A88_09655, partial [Candidatus Thermoplasmatota archaeon]